MTSAANTDKPTSKLAADVRSALLRSEPTARWPQDREQTLDALDALVARVTDLEAQVGRQGQNIQALYKQKRTAEAQLESEVAARFAEKLMTDAAEARVKRLADDATGELMQELEKGYILQATHDAIVEGLNRERLAAEAQVAFLKNQLAGCSQSLSDANRDYGARLDEAETQVAALTQERDQWKTRAEYEEDQKRIVAKAHLEELASREAAEAALATTRQALADIELEAEAGEVGACWTIANGALAATTEDE